MTHARLRTVVVGGSGTIGSAIMHHHTARGDTVACMDICAPVCGPPFIEMDVTDRQSVSAAFATAAKMLGGIDVCVNACGFLQAIPFDSITSADMQKHLDINIMGSLHVGQEAARHMREHGGRILFLSSIHGQIGVPGRGAYAASKAGIAAMARVMAAELGGQGIRVNILAPGPVDGGMQPDPSTRAGWCKEAPIQRVAELDEIAKIASFLTSDDASFISGQTIQVDGGVSISRLIANR
ncbi:MAG: SDR family oxidoreductase [Stappiaceae bacterium]